MEEESISGEAAGTSANYDTHRLGYNPQVQDGGYDPHLEVVRMESIKKIKGRFEHIFQKYGKDFDGVADEIDMTTGALVVDNGHLQNMAHEVDAGNGDALALSRTFDDDEVDDEDEEGSSVDSEAEVERDGRGSSSGSPDEPGLDFSWQDDTADSFTSLGEDDDIALPVHNDTASTPKMGPKRRKDKERAETAYAAIQHPATDAILDQMPGLKESMLALQNKYRRGQGMAPGDIQELGMSIANRLASLIKGGEPFKKSKRQSAQDSFSTGDDSRGRRMQRDSSPVEPIAPTPARSPGSKSLWAPLQCPRRRPKSKRVATTSMDLPGEEPLLDSFVLQTIMHQSALEPDELQGPTTVRSCSHCTTTETLSWRKGLNGADLCNNCGMYYYRYGLMRPLNSSTSGDEADSGEMGHPNPIQGLAPYTANTSRPLDGINLFGLHFTAREDAQLIKLKEIDRLTWDQITAEHPGRTPYALQCRYSKMLCGKPCEARDILRSRGYEFYVDTDGNTVARQPGKFTEEEDDMLLKLREEDDLDWDAVALQLPGRTAEDVEQRYDELARQILGDQYIRADVCERSEQNSNPRKGGRDRSASERSSVRYTPEEDSMILKLREDDKLSWQNVARQIPGRTLLSIQRHYSRDIGPYGRSRSTTPRGSPALEDAPRRPRKYTEAEDATLMRLRDENDLDWERIAERLPDRSASSLANRYYYKVNKGDSRPSSRASSVSRSPARHRATSLPAANLEAQFDALESEALQADEAFTDAEDELIIKLRELECLSWDQIAMEMPSRTVSSISCRYYQYLLPRKVPEIRKTEQALDPALASNGALPAGEASSSRLQLEVAQLSGPQDSGMSPSEAPESAETEPEVQGSNGHGSKTRKRKRQSDVPQPNRSVAARRSDAPMLRQALQGNLNRQSESAVASPVGVANMSGMNDGANDNVLVDGDELSMIVERSFQSDLLPSTLTDTELPLPSEDRFLRSSKKRRSAYPETPLRRDNGRYPNSGPTPLNSALYLTPSRYQNQCHPYFVAEVDAQEPPAPGNPRPVPEPVVRTNVPGEEVAFGHDKRSSRTKRRAPKHSPEPRQRPFVAEYIEDDHEDGEDDIQGEYFTSRKSKGTSDAVKSFRVRRPATASKRNDEPEASTARRRSRSVDVEDETEEDDIDMPDLGTDDDNDSSESKEEDEDDDELRCRPRQHSPLFDPRQTVEEAKHRKDAGPLRGKITAIAAKGGDGNAVKDVNKDIDLSSVPPEHLVRPDISWTELNFMALKSRAPEPMHTREVYEYIEANFPFFSLCKGHWRDSIRGNLSTRAEFVKVSNDKAALWALADPNQETVRRPKGVKRGRRPIGVERLKEPKPVKKLGRPSNASKGLPLKRVDRRNYIPAAERKRLAALQAEGGQHEKTARDATGLSTNAPGSHGAAQSTTADGKDSTEQRSARASTIEDSDAGEQLELVDCPSKPSKTADDDAGVATVNNPLATEPDLPVPSHVLVAPIANMTAMSNIDHTPDGSDDLAKQRTTAADELSSEATPASNRPGLRSSSPALTSTHRLPGIYGKSAATPGTGRSTLFQQLASAPSAFKSASTFAQKAISGAGTPLGAGGTPGSGTRRRVVETPARLADDSEDELA